MLDYFFHKINPQNIKISMVMMVRNEEDIIKDNIIFHANLGVDNFVIMDNGSTDSTGDILKELQKQYEITVIYNPSDEYKQKKWMTMLAKKAKQIYNPDWIINNDADEFWIPKKGNLKDVLNFKGSVLQIPRSNMLIYEGINNYKKSLYRTSNQVLYKEDLDKTNIILGKIGRKTIINPHGYIQTNSGNHSAEHLAFWKKREFNDIHIYHYPIRSFEQFKKNIENRAKLLKNNAKMGSHYKRWVKIYKEGKLEEEYKKMLFSKDEIKCLEKMNIIKMDETPYNYFKKFELINE